MVLLTIAFQVKILFNKNLILYSFLIEIYKKKFFYFRIFNKHKIKINKNAQYKLKYHI